MKRSWLSEFMTTCSAGHAAFVSLHLGEAIWESGESMTGPTVSSLVEQSARHRVWIGTTFLEAEGEHFYNSGDRQFRAIRAIQPGGVFPGGSAIARGDGSIASEPNLGAGFVAAKISLDRAARPDHWRPSP
jgi:hypothetical protein